MFNNFLLLNFSNIIKITAILLYCHYFNEKSLNWPPANVTMLWAYAVKTQYSCVWMFSYNSIHYNEIDF